MNSNLKPKTFGFFSWMTLETLGSLFGCLLGVVTVFLKAYVLYVIYGWYMLETLGVQISYTFCLAIILVCNVLRNQHAIYKGHDMCVARSLFQMFLTPLFVLFVAWIIKLIVM